MRTRVSEFFFTKNPNPKNIFFSVFLFFRGGGVLGGWGRWMDSRTGPNQFAPSTSSKLVA